jgi:hypothetical protein
MVGNVLLSANPARGSKDNDRLFIYFDMLLCISSAIVYASGCFRSICSTMAGE